METRPLIFDCDPGQDDAISLIMAMSPANHLDIRAITTVAGNTSVQKCQRNARMMVEICSRPDIPVFAGLVPTGPLTNIATALTRAPDIAERVAEIVIMGGARSEAGNITPSAEFNIYVDPHAAKIVFDTPVKKTVFGLDVTHKALIQDAHVDRIAELNTKMGNLLSGMLRSDYAEYDRAKFGTAGTPRNR